MATRQIRQSYQEEGELARMPGVRRIMAARADEIAAAARRVAAEAGVPRLPVTRESGTRPRGRPYERVSVPLSPEFGTSSQTRLAILSQALHRR